MKLMKTYTFAVAAALCLMLALAPAVVAQDGEEEEKPAKPAKVSVVGQVNMTLDDENNVAAVVVTTEDDAVYFVVLNDLGKKLGKEMDGKRAEVIGTLNEDEDILVESYKAAPKKTAPVEDGEEG